jgi:predicted HTH transcriptional regulator
MTYENLQELEALIAKDKQHPLFKQGFVTVFVTLKLEKALAQARQQERERCVKATIKEFEKLHNELCQVAYDTSESGRELHLGHVEQYIEQHIAKLKSEDSPKPRKGFGIDVIKELK